MAHTVGEKAALAVKNSEKKKAVDTRTPEEIFKAIRGNLAARLAVTPGDQRFLLSAYDAEKEFSHKLAEENLKLKNLNASQSTMIVDLREQIEQFRSVYEMENSRSEVTVTREPVPAANLFGFSMPDPYDHGGNLELTNENS